MTPFAERIARRILDVDNFENVAHVCCDWEEFTQKSQSGESITLLVLTLMIYPKRTLII